VVLYVSGTDNFIVQPVGVTGSDGVAEGKVTSTKAELKTVSAEVDGQLIDATLEVEWVAGPVDHSVSTLVSDADTVTADGTDNCRITVTARDAYGNPVSGETVGIEATDTGGGNTIFILDSQTDENGVAVGWLSSTVAEMKTVRATIGASYVTPDIQVLFIADQPDRFVISHDGSGTAGSAENVTIQVFDANDNIVDWFDDVIQVYTDTPETTDYITWGPGGASGTITGESADTVSYDFSPLDNGEVTLTFTDERAETVRFTARYGSVYDQSAAAMTIGPAPADSIFIIAGQGQTEVVNNPVPQPLTVGVEDQFGNRIPGAPVRFEVITGNGTVDTDLGMAGDQEWTLTDASGVAICASWILGTMSGIDSDEVRASIPTGSDTEVTFTATAEHDVLASV
jgi:hypothetical protein